MSERITFGKITREQAKNLMDKDEEVCYRKKGQTVCAKIKSTRGTKRATLENGWLVPYTWLVPKKDWKEDYTPKRKKVSTPFSDANYERSNALEIKPIPISKLSPMQTKVKKMGICFDGMRDVRKKCSLSQAQCNVSFNKNRKCVEENAQGLLDRLNDHYKTPHNKIFIDGKRKNYGAGGDLYGFYNTGSTNIRVFPYTKVKEDVVGTKTFLKTTVHEWNHHYDHKALGLNSIHTGGFYKRVGTIYNQLKSVLD